MRRAITITTLMILSACSSTPWNDSEPQPVDAGLLAHVPESERQEIQEARADRAQVREDLAIVEREAQEVASRLDLAADDLDVLEARLDEAEERVEHAEEFGTQEDLADARDRLYDSQAAVRLARTKISYYDDLRALAKRMVDLQEARLELATARVELSEAAAIARLDRPAAQEVEVHAYEERVRRLEDEVAANQVEVRAARTRVELRHELLSERAQAVPASFRLNDPEPVDELLTLELAGDGEWEGHVDAEPRAQEVGGEDSDDEDDDR
jgi:hypothetical protein